MSNAVKFTPSGHVALGLRQLARDGAQATLCFEVKDSGIGIAPDQQSRIFEPFRQGGPCTTRRFGGTGLGLSIVRHLVELMGGQIHLESRPAVGSKFSVMLPLDIPGPAQCRPPLQRES